MLTTLKGLLDGLQLRIVNRKPQATFTYMQGPQLRMALTRKTIANIAANAYHQRHRISPTKSTIYDNSLPLPKLFHQTVK